METVFVGPAPRIALTVEGAGEVVFFLHGIRGNRRNWDAQVKAFSPHLRCVAWDARGYGDSDDYEGWLQFDHLIGDVLRVIEHLRVERVHLVGLAMGGRLARQVALRHAERLHSLVLVNTNPGFDGLSAEEVRRFITERNNKIPDIARRLLGRNAGPEVVQQVEESLARLRERSYVKILEASVAQDRSAPIEQIQTPTLVIAGAEDRVLPPALAYEVARRIPKAELVMMDGVGHFPNLEHPDEFNSIVLPFLLKQAGKS